MAIDMTMPVLVVDDYNTMIRIIRNLLKQLGFADVDDANDGTTALAKMHAKRYGLVISHWNMEPRNRYDPLRQGRARPEPGKSPLIHGAGDTVGVEAGNDEQAIDAERGRAFDIRPEGIADRQHPMARRCATAKHRGFAKRRLVDRRIRLAAIKHFPAKGRVGVGQSAGAID